MGSLQAPHRTLTGTIVPLGTRNSKLLLHSAAAGGFVLGALVLGLLVSRQMALVRAQDYLRSRYGMNMELPVDEIRPALLTRTPRIGSAPPGGFCWGVQLRLGALAADVLLNPWTHEVVDVEVER